VASLYGRHLSLHDVVVLVEMIQVALKGRHYGVISATLGELVGQSGFPRSLLPPNQQ